MISSFFVIVMNPLIEFTRRKFPGHVYTALAGVGLMHLLSGGALAAKWATQAS